MKRYVRIDVMGPFVLAMVLFMTAGAATASAQLQQLGPVGAQCSEEEPGCGCNPEYQDCGCTSIMVGKQASTDGSVMTAHSCDGNYRTWLQIEPARDNPTGAQRPIYWGKLHTETPDDLRGMTLKGSIPEVAHTYRYFNVAYPAMNEKGLAIGETTFGGLRELRNDEGLFLIENLQALALERTTTARDAIRMIGELVKAFIALQPGFEPSDELRLELLGFARKKLGSAVAPKEIAFTNNLPKTRSGKIMRRLLKARELGLPEGDTSTLED